MREVKVRLAVVERLCLPDLGLPQIIVREMAYLQFRMVSETIALGCLLVHEDIPATQGPKFRKEYNADVLLKKLDGLHPDFYPKPMLRTEIAPGRLSFNGINPAEAMPKTELMALYAKLGDKLHKGSLKNLLKQQPAKQNDIIERDVRPIAQKFYKLLSLHLIMRLGGTDNFICLMQNPEDGGDVQVAYAEAHSGPDGE